MTKAHSIHDPVNSDDGSAFASDASSGLLFKSSSGSIGTTDGLQDVIYLREPGTADLVSVSDINQGGIGDCFLLSALGEIARQSVIQDMLGFIPSMIHANANGSETVSLYQVTGYNTTSNSLIFGRVSETVTNSFLSDGVNSGADQVVVGTHKEIWPQVIEKAYAQLEGGYGAISDGGYPSDAMMALTGENAYAGSPDGLTLAKLLSWADNNDLITFDTGSSGTLPYQLFNDHSYMFEGLVGSGANTMVRLGNPWGFDQPSPVPVSQIANMTSGIVQIDVGHFNTGAGHAPTSWPF